MSTITINGMKVKVLDQEQEPYVPDDGRAHMYEKCRCFSHRCEQCGQLTSDMFCSRCRDNFNIEHTFEYLETHTVQISIE